MAAPKKDSTPRILNVNILYPQGINPKLPVKFLRWLIAYGRYIVVVVEIVVLACFAMRFKLDEDLNKLKEEINGQIPYLQGLTEQEELTKSGQTHLRLKLVKETYSFSQLNVGILNKVAAQTPTNTKVSNINIDSIQEPNVILFKTTASTLNSNDVALFLNGLRSEKSFSDIGLVSISFDQGTLIFTITGKVKK